MLQVTVDRSKWVNGSNNNKATDNDNPSLLLNRHGNMCCLGFAALAAGDCKSEIDGCMYPNETFTPNLSKGRRADILQAIANINDNSGITNEERERYLIEEGKRVDIEFSFVGKWKGETVPMKITVNQTFMALNGKITAHVQTIVKSALYYYDLQDNESELTFVQHSEQTVAVTPADDRLAGFIEAMIVI